jgi:hypothetical protein
MNVEIGTDTPIFLFWEYLFQNFGILSLQCVMTTGSSDKAIIGNTSGVDFSNNASKPSYLSFSTDV